MRKFSVAIPYHCTHYVEVWASNKEEAIKKAIEESDPQLCYHCSKDLDIDGMVDILNPIAEVVNDGKGKK